MSSSGNWVLQIDPAVYKHLDRIPRKDVGRILLILNKEFVKNPFAGDIRKMAGEQNVWRRRAGAYRIKFELILSRKIVYIFGVERRKSNTY